MGIIIEHNIKFWSNLKLKYESRALMMNFLLTGLIERWRALVWIAPLKSNRFNLYSLCSKWSSKILKKYYYIQIIIYISYLHTYFMLVREKGGHLPPRQKYPTLPAPKVSNSHILHYLTRTFFLRCYESWVKVDHIKNETCWACFGKSLFRSLNNEPIHKP